MGNSLDRHLRQPRLTQTEYLTVFMTVLSSLHSTKRSLIADIPFIVSKALAPDVRYLIMELGEVVNGQIIRISLARSILKAEFNVDAKVMNRWISLDSYFTETIVVSSAATDVIILTHLAFSEGTEIEGFKLLRNLARSMGSPDVVRLMSMCQKEAIKSKKALDTMLERYG